MLNNDFGPLALSGIDFLNILNANNLVTIYNKKPDRGIHELWQTIICFSRPWAWCVNDEDWFTCAMRLL